MLLPLKLGSCINRIISCNVHSQSQVGSMILFTEFQRIKGKGTIIYLKVISRKWICVTDKNHEEVGITCDSIAHWTGHLSNTVTASANLLGTM